MNIQLPDVNIWALAPFLIVVITGAVVLFWDLAFRPKSNNALILVSLLGLAVAIIACSYIWSHELWTSSFNNSIMNDQIGIVFNIILLGVTILAVLFSEPYLEAKGINFSEFYPMVLFTTAGAMLMISSLDLIVVFLGLETLSLSLYVLTGLSRTEERSGEAAIKYFLLGSFASCFFLYGIALVYGATGSTRLDIAFGILNSATPDQMTLLIAGLALLLVGFGFKGAFVPFHMWTPDVYQGAPTSITGYMAAAVKVAVFASLLRVVLAMPSLIHIWQPILFVIALLTMTGGNIVAIMQKDAKRMLAYSSIAQAGYILIGIIAHNPLGISATIYYTMAYSLMTIGAFAVVSLMTRQGKESTAISDMTGLWKTHPLAAVLMVLFMASLAGIPPTAGFFGKFNLFQAAIQASQTNPGPIGGVGQITLAFALAVNSAISLFFYVGLIVPMYVRDPEPGLPVPSRMRPGMLITVLACAIGVLYTGLAYSQVNHYFTKAANSASQSMTQIMRGK